MTDRKRAERNTKLLAGLRVNATCRLQVMVDEYLDGEANPEANPKTWAELTLMYDYTRYILLRMTWEG